MTSDPSVHDLFALDPKDFVAARDQLARELKSAGDKEGAAAVKTLRRPTVPAWALNQVARNDSDLVDELVRAAADARGAQDKALAGDAADDLRDALTRRRNATIAVARAARTAIDTSGRSADSHERDIEAAIDAATASDEMTEVFRRGELSDVGTVEAADDDMLAALLASSAGERPQPAQKHEPSRRLEKAREKLDAAREAAAAAATRLKQAERDLASAQREHEAAQHAHDSAVAAVDRAEEAVHRYED